MRVTIELTPEEPKALKSDKPLYPVDITKQNSDRAVAAVMAVIEEARRCQTS